MTRNRPRVGITTKAGGAETPVGRLYAAAVTSAGGEVLWLEPEVVSGTDPGEILADLDALLLSGGVDADPRHFGEEVSPTAGVTIDAERDRAELPLIRAAVAADLPVLGICRGIQMLNVAAGGSLHQDLGLLGLDPSVHQQRLAGKDAWDMAHPVRIAPAGRLHAALGSEVIDVNSFHHQAVKAVAEAFVVTARAPDGVIEGIEHGGRTFVVGVQWHPERMVDRYPAQRRLFEAFIQSTQSPRSTQSAQSIEPRTSSHHR